MLVGRERRRRIRQGGSFGLIVASFFTAQKIKINKCSVLRVEFLYDNLENKENGT